MKALYKIFTFLTLLGASAALSVHAKADRTTNLCGQYAQCCTQRNELIKSCAPQGHLGRIERNHAELAKIHDGSGLTNVAQRQTSTLRALNTDGESAELKNSIQTLGRKITKLKRKIHYQAAQLERENAQLAHDIFNSLSNEAKTELRRLNALKAEIAQKLRANNISPEKILGQHEEFEVLFI